MGEVVCAYQSVVILKEEDIPGVKLDKPFEACIVSELISDDEYYAQFGGHSVISFLIHVFLLHHIQTFWPISV